MLRLGLARVSGLHSCCRPILTTPALRPFPSSPLLPCSPSLPCSSSLPLLLARQSSFYKGSGADALWATMAGVSQQGKKRGRAKNTMQKKDLNRGQKIGYGKARVAWPVLTKKASFMEKGECGVSVWKVMVLLALVNCSGVKKLGISVCLRKDFLGK